MQDHFDNAYGKGKFEMVQVKNMAEKGCLDEAVKGCDGIAHVASTVSVEPDPKVVLTPSVAMVDNALNAAAKEPSVKRFVFCSSSVAANPFIMNKPYDLTDSVWNEISVRQAWAPPPYPPEQGYHCCCPSKIQSEQAVFKFVEDHKPQFVVNTVLPDFVTDVPVKPEKQGRGPSVGLLRTLWDGRDTWQILPPQFMIDLRDVALLHLACLTKLDLKGDRVFGYAHNKTWTDWIARLRRMYPDHTFPDPPANEGLDMANIIGQEKAEDCLRWFGRPGWRPMGGLWREACDAFASA